MEGVAVRPEWVRGEEVGREAAAVVQAGRDGGDERGEHGEITNVLCRLSLGTAEKRGGRACSGCLSS